MSLDPSSSNAAPPMDADELMQLSERISTLPPADAAWAQRMFDECLRARLSEAEYMARAIDDSADAQAIEQDITQIVLDAAEWLKTLWNVGYMGAGRLPASPRSAFPLVEMEDVLKSALLARIRSGKRPLPFAPPTRFGVPWHEVVEKSDPIAVEAVAVEDDGRIFAFAIDECLGWEVRECLEEGKRYRIQHQGKGPFYQLCIDSSGAQLLREPPSMTCDIALRERGSTRAYFLEWQDDDKIRSIPLRAASRERAEIEANHWIAQHHPERYGQIRFNFREVGPDA